MDQETPLAPYAIKKVRTLAFEGASKDLNPEARRTAPTRALKTLVGLQPVADRVILEGARAVVRLMGV